MSKISRHLKRTKQRKAPDACIDVMKASEEEEMAAPIIRVKSTWTTDQGNCVWLNDDPRSVRAMLRGNGDGREKLYINYAKNRRKLDPSISEEDLHESYAAFFLHQELQAHKERQEKFNKSLLSGRQNSAASFAGLGSGLKVGAAHIAMLIEKNLMGLALVASLAFAAANYL